MWKSRHLKDDKAKIFAKRELNAIDKIVKNKKGKAKVIKPGKDFSRYIKKIAK